MNNLLKIISRQTKTITQVPKASYHFPDPHHGGVTSNPGLTAKRIINCVGNRLRTIDPGRWDSIPITFKTHFRDENGFADVSTCIHVHDALEREFGIEIKDKWVLVTDIETAFYVVNQHHDSH